MTHNTNVLVCPTCKTYMTKASNSQTEHNDAPKSGDFCICANCAEILCFVYTNEIIAYHKATKEDIAVAIQKGIYSHLLATRDFILSGKHGYRNMTKEEIESANQKNNW